MMKSYLNLCSQPIEMDMVSHCFTKNGHRMKMKVDCGQNIGILTID